MEFLIYPGNNKNLLDNKINKKSKKILDFLLDDKVIYVTKNDSDSAIKLVKNIDYHILISDFTHEDLEKIKEIKNTMIPTSYFNFKGIFIKKNSDGSFKFTYFTKTKVSEEKAFKYMRCFKAWKDILTDVRIKTLSSI